MMKLTAQFPLADRAAQFAARIQEPGWYAEQVEYIVGRRKVSWQFDPAAHPTTEPAGPEWTHFQDMLEAVGYYGSDQRRKATLSAVLESGREVTRRAPMSY